MSLLKNEISFLEWVDVKQRIAVLEEAIFKKRRRLHATEAQKFLLLYHLGAIDLLRSLEVSQNHKDLYISLMLDIDPDNARKFLSELGKTKKPLLETESNYIFLVDFFEKAKDKKREAEADKILTRIRARKEK